MSDDARGSADPAIDPMADDPTAIPAQSVPPVKTAPDGTPIKRTAPPAQWEAVGRHALADVLRHRRDRMDREVEEVASAIEYGAAVDEDHVRNLRDAVEVLELAVESRLVPLVDDLDSWERSADRIPVGVLYDALEIDQETLTMLETAREADDESAAE